MEQSSESARFVTAAVDGEMYHNLFVCKCNSVEHQFVVSQFDDEEEVYISVRLNAYGNVFQRLWRALKYVFNIDDAEYSEVILDKENQQKFIELLQASVQTEHKVSHSLTTHFEHHLQMLL